MKTLVALVVCLVLCVLPWAVEARECQDLDIRNDLRSFELLRNCTVVHGFLQMVLMDGPYNDFTDVEFPELREITGFLLLFRVFGLVNLGNLFPNLEVIRGETLFTDYALILYGLPDLVEVNLKSLIVIERGFIRIELCNNLCNLQAIDWSQITRQQSPTGNVIPISKFDPIRCTSLTHACGFCPIPGKCWSRVNCQKDLGSQYTKQLLGNCHKQCLGRCSETDKSARGCFVCKHVLDNGVCTDECSPPRILNQYSHRCVTEDQCRRARRVVHNGECLIQCPKGFLLNRANQTCSPCTDNCPRVCPGDIIEYISDAQEFNGCSIINGNILIKMASDVQNINEELEYHLGDIEVINGRLQVFRSPALTSLNFFKNLKVIKGDNLDLDDYSVHIYDNPSLKKLFDFTNREKLEIQRGGITFHYNPKLCTSEIEYFMQNSIVSEPEKNNIPLSNGHRESDCDFVQIESDHQVVSPTNITFYWQPFEPNNTKDTVEGYVIHYIETLREDMNWYNSRESCSKYAWKEKILDVATDLQFDQNRQMYMYTLQELKQMTKYAYYIQSYHRLFSTGISGRSTVKVVTTPFDTLSPPVVSTFLKGEDSINLLWRTPAKERPFINFFYVDVIKLPDLRRIVDARNYCRHPIDMDPSIQAKLRQLEYEEEISECNCDETLSEEDFINLQHESHDRHNILRLGDTTISCADEPNHEICEAYENRRFKRNMHHFEKNFVLKENHTIDKRDIKNSPDYFNSYRIERTADNFTISDLQPFHNYAFEFFACHNETKCSPYFFHADRTNPNLTTDNLANEDVELTYDGNSTVTMNFREPPVPNGATVGFKVEQKVMEKDNQTSVIHCVTLLEHERNNYSFIVANLQPNVYGFRVRTMSLALESQWTEWKVVTVIEEQDNPIKIGITLVIIAVVSLGVSCSIYSYRTLNCFRKAEDTIYLMADLRRPNEPREDETELLTISSSMDNSSSLNASLNE